MKHAFWIVAIVGLGLVAFVQLNGQQSPDQSILVTGMKPQVDLIRKVAEEENWSITCEGKSGETTVLRLTPGFFASSKSAETLRDRLSLIASSTSSLTGTEAEYPTCDQEPTLLKSPDGEDINSALEFGTAEMLEPYLAVAKSCGFDGAEILPINATDLIRYREDFPDEWRALYSGPNSANRYGPATCYTLMSYRLKAAGGDS